jgi:hypothetical protein
MTAPTTPVDHVEVYVGGPCIFVDPTGQMHPALITAIWGPTSLTARKEYNQKVYDDHVSRTGEAPHWSQEDMDAMPFVPPSINVVYVECDEAKTDSYGRQIARATSVPNRASQTAHGYYYLGMQQNQ